MDLEKRVEELEKKVDRILADESKELPVTIDGKNIAEKVATEISSLQKTNRRKCNRIGEANAEELRNTGDILVSVGEFKEVAEIGANKTTKESLKNLVK